jgi:hypothetical protein
MSTDTLPDKSRTTLILGIIVVVFVVALAATVFLQDSQLNTFKDDYNTLNSQYNTLVGQYNTLLSQYASQANITYLADSQIWVNSYALNQPAGNYSYWNESASYAGYVIVNVQSSTTNNTYAEVTYNSSYGVSYGQAIIVGTSGTAAFPILPSTNIQVGVGNTNLLEEANETVTITYYY